MARFEELKGTRSNKGSGEWIPVAIIQSLWFRGRKKVTGRKDLS